MYKREQQAQQFTGCKRCCQGIKVRGQGHCKDKDLWLEDKDLWSEDKDKDLWSEDKNKDKDLWFEDKDKDKDLRSEDKDKQCWNYKQVNGKAAMASDENQEIF